jgi:uncharacterized protein (TIGR02996 family)
MRLEKAFLQDVLEHPDDDTPRLVFADWLEDNGDPDRAEFIRVQCRLAGLPEADSRCRDLQRREADLLARHQPRWVAAVAECCVSWPGFHRGFIEAVDCDASVFVSVAEKLFLQAPIQDLTLQNPVGHLSELARCSWLSRLWALRLSIGNPAPLLGSSRNAFVSFCQSPHLRNLRVLDLTGCAIGSSAAMVLGAPQSPPALVELGLAGNELENWGVGVLADSPQRAGLEVLDLRNNALTDDAARLLARSPHLGRLRWLLLEGNSIGNDGISALLDSPALSGLAHLSCDLTNLSANVRDRLRQRFGEPA